MKVCWAMTSHSCSHVSYVYPGFTHFVGGSGPATLLKPVVPNSFRISESFVQLSLEKGTASSEGVELPSKFPQWKLITIDSSITSYSLLTKGIPEGYPPIYMTHVLSFANGNWQLWVYSKSNSVSSVSAASSAMCTTASITDVLDDIEKLSVCQGSGSPPFDAPKIRNAFVDSVPTPTKDGSLLLQSFHDSDCTCLYRQQ